MRFPRLHATNPHQRTPKNSSDSLTLKKPTPQQTTKAKTQSRLKLIRRACDVFLGCSGSFIHLGWDITMHRDINFGAPFMRIANPLINSQVAIWIGVLSLVLVLPAYFIGTKIMKATLFGNCREITTTKNVVRF